MVEAGQLPLWCNAVTPQDIMQLSKPAMGLYWQLLKHFGHGVSLSTQSVALPYKQHEIEHLKRHIL